MAKDNVEDNFIPRNYQVSLMEIALRQNTIIYLPTGSGKTFIAIMVLKRMSGALLKPYNEGGSISVILVNSVNLVYQHTKYVINHTDLKVKGFSGEMNLDFWRKEEWEMQFNNNNVLVMTAQIFLNLILSHFIDVSKVNLLIFDECHNGVDDQPMRQIMKNLHCLEKQPRILGLTATLLNRNCNPQSVMNEVENLEITYNSKVATVDGLEHIIGYSTNPKEDFKFCDPSILSDTAQIVIQKLEKMKEIISHIPINIENQNCMIDLGDNLKPLEAVDILKRLKNLINDLCIHINMLGTFGGYKACIAHLIQVERLKKHCELPELVSILCYVLTTISWSKEYLAQSMAMYSGLEQIYKCSSDKVIKLFEILEEYQKQSKEELCCLIFTQRRFTAKIIHHILTSLKQFNEKFHNIRSNFIVGNNNNPYNDTRENLFINKKNREVMESFFNKEINLLCCSNVLEEGVDIPKCTLVIKFDKSMDYRSYIQSKGRARHKDSFYYTIIEKEEVQKWFKKYAVFKEVEISLTDFLMGKNNERTSPSKDEVDRMNNEETLAPYFTGDSHNSPQVNMLSAIGLLCRYCSSLASDQYTLYTPEWYVEEDSRKHKLRVVILLPTICPISHPIKGSFTFNRKIAKRAAALTACIMLHKCGELDDNLLPRIHEPVKEDVSQLFVHWPADTDKKAGFKKMKRLHTKQIAPSLKGKIEANTTLFLHTIRLTPNFEKVENSDESILYDMYTDPLHFGFLTPKPMPELCKFPIYSSEGTLSVGINRNCQVLELNEKQLQELREFHYLIFNDVLKLLKPFLLFDNSGINSEMLILVPIRDNNIDFGIISEHKTIKNKQLEPSSSERMKMEVSEEDYWHKIVSPWYRSQPSDYIVIHVCLDKNAISDFPNPDFTNFISYYREKHSLQILSPNQPLLLVKALSNRLNMFKPRGSSGRKSKKRYEDFIEYLLPELVVKQEFPASLWIQARLIPTILSRITYLLKLHHLQEEIAKDIGVDEKYLQNCPSLELDNHLIHYTVPEELPKNSEVTIPTSDLLALECSSLVTQQYNKDFTTKMLEAQFSWRNIEEPKDIEREINVTVLDIDHYEKFISQSVNKSNKSPKQTSPEEQNLPAITYDQGFEEKPLKILSILYQNQCPNLCQFYEALTAAEANDIVNLERLETLGDSFLKLIASLYIIFKFPKYNEGQATSLKGQLVSNKNLYYLAVQKELGGILKNSDLSPNDWTPPGFCIPDFASANIEKKEISVNVLFNYTISPEEQISGQLSKKSVMKMKTEDLPVSDDEENSYTSMCHFLNKQYVGDKTIADGVEALLGAFLQNGGIKGAMKFVEWIGIIPPSEQLEKLLETAQIDPILDKINSDEKISMHLPQWVKFEEYLGYKFNNRGFLLQALTHSSYSPNRVTQSYEKLEFIGDAILDFLITCYIYEYCDCLNPGQVTDLRSALVNNNTFGSLVVRSHFHKFLLIMNFKLQGHIDKFAEYMHMRDYNIDDEVLILLEEQDLNIAEYVDVPKALGDVFEALAGAVYLDSGKDLNTVWKVFYKIMWKEIKMFSKDVPKNVIRRLHEYHTAYPRFSKAVLLENNKTMVCLDFMCEGRLKRVHGFGSNKIAARRAAAKIALRALKT